MNRFTEWHNKKGAGLPGKDCFTKLAKYEDTGLEPEEIIEMRGEVKTAYDEGGIPYATEYTGYEAKHITDLRIAEQDGRLFVLPCKVGDRIWVLSRRTGETPEILEERVMALTEAGKGMLITISYREYCARQYVKNIGKLMDEGHLSVFLTRAEAEAALKGGNENA